MMRNRGNGGRFDAGSAVPNAKVSESDTMCRGILHTFALEYARLRKSANCLVFQTEPLCTIVHCAV